MKVWNIQLVSKKSEQEIRDWNFGEWIHIIWYIKHMLEKMSNSSLVEHTKIITLLKKKERTINGNTIIPRFTSLIRSSKTACKVKTREMKINFPLLPDMNNDQFARGRSSYK
jgi:hypothetical protein